MCCVSLKPEALCALGYLDLCLWQLNLIRGIEFRIFTEVRNTITHFGKCTSIIQIVWSMELHLIDTSSTHWEPTLGSSIRISLKRGVPIVFSFLQTQAKLFTSTQNTKIKNTARVFCPCAWDLFRHSISFPWYKYISNAWKVTKDLENLRLIYK